MSHHANNSQVSQGSQGRLMTVWPSQFWDWRFPKFTLRVSTLSPGRAWNSFLHLLEVPNFRPRPSYLCHTFYTTSLTVLPGESQ